MLLQERNQIQIPGSVDDMSVCLSNSFSGDSDHVRVEHSYRGETTNIAVHSDASSKMRKFLNF